MTNRHTLKARTPEDLLAVVPVVLGFHPEDSIVMLTFGAPAESFHARIDLPPPQEVPEAVAPLLRAAGLNRVARAAFVVYTADAALGSLVARLVREDFSDAGIEVITVLRADGSHWYCLDTCGDSSVGRPYDVTSHPFAVQSVFDGAVTHPNRASLAASLLAPPQAVVGVLEALPQALLRLGDSQASVEAAWIADTVGAVVSRGRRLNDGDVARLVVGVSDPKLRDVAWLQMRRPAAAGHVGLWTEVLRRTPEELAAAPAGLLAFAAWLAGQGALAWCAVDRCRSVEPDYSLAAHVAMALEQALPPSVWDEPGRARTTRGTGSGPGGGVVT